MTTFNDDVPASDDVLSARLGALVRARCGKVVAVPGGRIFYLPNEPKRRAEPKEPKIPPMEPRAFAAWLDGRKLRFMEAARLFSERTGAKYRSSDVGRWANGDRPVPARVKTEIDAIDAETAKAEEVRKPRAKKAA